MWPVVTAVLWSVCVSCLHVRHDCELWKTAEPLEMLQKITTPAPQQWDFYRPDGLPDTQPTALVHWRHKLYINLLSVFHAYYVLVRHKMHMQHVGHLLWIYDIGGFWPSVTSGMNTTYFWKNKYWNVGWIGSCSLSIFAIDIFLLI